VKLSICTTVKNRSWVELDRRVLKLFPNFVRSVVYATRDTDAVELVVADWQSTDHLLDEWLWSAARPISVKVVDVAEEGFSRGRGLNLAADAATHDVLFFLDADMLVSRKLLTDACRHVRYGKLFFPICFYPLDPKGERGVWATEGYGNVAVSQDVFAQCRWPEAYRWGGQDSDFFRRARELAPVVRRRYGDFRHQWHPIGPGWRDRYSKAGASLVLGVAVGGDDCKRLASLLDGFDVDVSCGLDGEDPAAEVPSWGANLSDYTLRMRGIWVKDTNAQQVGDVGRYWLNYVSYLMTHIDTPSKVIFVVRSDSGGDYVEKVFDLEKKYGSRLLVCAVGDENWHQDEQIRLGVKDFLGIE
jgi:hypothetical protein